MKKLIAFLLTVVLFTTSYGAALANVLRLPDGLTVIESEAFAGNTSLDDVILPDGVTAIGSRAFADSSVSRIYLPASVQSIARDAFSQAEGVVGYGPGNTAASAYFARHQLPFETDVFTYRDLPDGSVETTGYMGAAAEVVIPEYNSQGKRVTRIGDNTFKDRKDITKVTLPNSIESIGAFAFAFCSGLRTINLPYGLKIIGVRAFMQCNSLTAISMPDTVTEIREAAFEDSIRLASAPLPKGVKIIGDNIFGGCPLTSIVIPESVESMGESTFVFTAISEIRIPENITAIPTNMCYGCRNLTKVYIPSSVESIAGAAFWECGQGLTIYGVPGSAAEAHAQWIGAAFVEMKEQRFTYRDLPGGSVEIAGYTGTVTEVVIPEYNPQGKRVTRIGDDAFKNHPEITKVTLPGSIESIGAFAFAYCSGLSEINLPYGLKIIGVRAFMQCIGLTAVSMPDTVTEIREAAFEDSIHLASAPLPYGVKIIGDNIFGGCPLTSIVIPASVESLGESTFVFTAISEIRIPENITEIPRNMCYGCRNLTRVYIPASVQSIAGAAFWECGQGLTIYGEPGSVAEAHAQMIGAAFAAVQGGELAGFTAEASRKDCYTLTWNPVAGTNQYKVFTYLDSQCKTLFSITETQNSAAYVKTDVGTKYWFVLEYTYQGQTRRSAPITVNPLQPMAAPENLRLELTGDGHVIPSWNAVPGAIGYRVYSSITTNEWSPDVDWFSFVGQPEDGDFGGLWIDDGETLYIWVCADNGDGPNRRAFAQVERGQVSLSELLEMINSDDLPDTPYIEGIDYTPISTEGVTNPDELSVIEEFNALMLELGNDVSTYNSTVSQAISLIEEMAGYLGLESIDYSDGGFSIASDLVRFSYTGEVAALLHGDYEVISVEPIEENTLQMEIIKDGSTYYLINNEEEIYVSNQPLSAQSDMMLIGAQSIDDFSIRASSEEEDAAMDRLSGALLFENTIEAVVKLYQENKDKIRIPEKLGDKLSKLTEKLSEYKDKIHIPEKMSDKLSIVSEIMKKAKMYEKIFRVALNAAGMACGRYAWAKNVDRLFALTRIIGHGHPTYMEELDIESRKTALQLKHDIAYARGLTQGQICFQAAEMGISGILLILMIPAAGTIWGSTYTLGSIFSQEASTVVGSLTNACINTILVGQEWVNEGIGNVLEELMTEIELLDAELHYDFFGIVKDQYGNNLNRVKVTCRDIIVYTDSNGYYFMECAVDTADVTFELDGYEPQTITVHMEPHIPQPLHVTLYPKLSIIKGTVYEDKTYRRLGAVYVSCNNTYWGSTDTEGNYRIEVPVGNVELVFSADGYVPKTIEINAVAGVEVVRDAVIEPYTFGTISGTVRDEVTKEPIPRIFVRYTNMISTVTDSNGFYSLSVPIGVEDGVLTFDGQNASYANKEYPIVLHQGGEQITRDMNMAMESGVIGKVIDENGEPVVGALVTLEYQFNPRAASYVYCMTARTDTTGRFQFAYHGISQNAKLTLCQERSLFIFNYNSSMPNVENMDSNGIISISQGEIIRPIYHVINTKDKVVRRIQIIPRWGMNQSPTGSRISDIEVNWEGRSITIEGTNVSSFTIVAESNIVQATVRYTIELDNKLYAIVHSETYEIPKNLDKNYDEWYMPYPNDSD